jgi:hypothetical protein
VAAASLVPANAVVRPANDGRRPTVDEETTSRRIIDAASCIGRAAAMRAPADPTPTPIITMMAMAGIKVARTQHC